MYVKRVRKLGTVAMQHVSKGAKRAEGKWEPIRTFWKGLDKRFLVIKVVKSSITKCNGFSDPEFLGRNTCWVLTKRNLPIYRSAEGSAQEFSAV